MKASINTGLSDKLKLAFPNCIPILKPEINTKNITSGEWIAGFTSGEGSFDVQITTSQKNKLNYQVQVRFRISQHIRDQQLLNLLIEYFNCGRIENFYKSGKAIDFIVTGLKNISNIIVPFLINFQLEVSNR
jgi:LAGLIDADG endonuclease